MVLEDKTLEEGELLAECIGIEFVDRDHVTRVLIQYSNK